MSMPWDPSLEWDKPGGVGGTDTRPSVLDGLVADGEFSKVVPNHLRLDLDLVEGLPIVHSNYGAYHLWHNDHVAQMGPDRLGLLTSRRLLFLYMYRKQRMDIGLPLCSQQRNVAAYKIQQC